MTTIVIRSSRRWEGSGVKSVGSTALGITDTIFGSSAARSTVFSLLVYDTHTMWFVSHSDTVRSLLVSTELTSAKPKSEWSVNTCK